MDDVTMSRDQLHSRKVSFEINQPSIVVSPPEESTLSPPNEEKEKKVDEYRNWGQGYGEGGGGGVSSDQATRGPGRRSTLETPLAPGTLKIV